MPRVPAVRRSTGRSDEIRRRTLAAMIEAATVDCDDESEQITGLFTMLEEQLVVPFAASILGVVVTVEAVDLDRHGEIVAVCSRGRYRQALRILDLKLAEPLPRGVEWIEAYRHWLRR